MVGGGPRGALSAGSGGRKKERNGKKERKKVVSRSEQTFDLLTSLSLELSKLLYYSSLASSLLASPRAHVVSLLSGCARRPIPRVSPAARRVRYLESFRFFQ